MASLEERIAAAGRTVADDVDVRAALAELVAAQGSSRRRRRRGAWIGVGIGGALALAGCATVIALQPWLQVQPDRLVISQDWYDLSGDYLASCESVLDVSYLSAEAQAVVEERLRDRTPADYGIDVSVVPPKKPGQLSRTDRRTAEMANDSFVSAVTRDVFDALKTSGVDFDITQPITGISNGCLVDEAKK